MNDAAQSSDQHVAAISKGRLCTLVALTVLGIAIVYSYLQSNSANSAASDVQRENAAIRKDLENALALLAELKQAELGRLEEQSVNVNEVEKHFALLDNAALQVKELREELKKWNATDADFKKGELGRRVASTQETLKQYQALQSQPDPNPLRPDRLQARLDVLRKPLLKALASPIKSYRPSPSFDLNLLEVQQDIADSLAELQRRNAQFSGIIAQAPSKPSPEALALPQALTNLENALSIAQTQKIAEEVQKVREEFIEKLAAEKAQTERLNRELKLEKERRKREVEATTKRQAIQGLVDQRKQIEKDQKLKAARQVLERQFQHDLPEIKSLLKPFITDGRTQPGRHTFEMSVDVGPVSFSKLQGVGVLNRSVESQRLLWGMTTANRTNDRDLGGFPPYIGSQQDWFNKQPRVARAQELLIKYGQLMADKGMLAP